MSEHVAPPPACTCGLTGTFTHDLGCAQLRWLQRTPTAGPPPPATSGRPWWADEIEALRELRTRLETTMSARIAALEAESDARLSSWAECRRLLAGSTMRATALEAALAAAERCIAAYERRRMASGPPLIDDPTDEEMAAEDALDVERRAFMAAKAAVGGAT